MLLRPSTKQYVNERSTEREIVLWVRESIAGNTLQTNITLAGRESGQSPTLHETGNRLIEPSRLREIGAILAGGLAFAYPAYLLLMFYSHDWILAAGGRPTVTDFLVFWLAGHSALHGAAASAYVPAVHHAAEAAAAGHGFSGQLPWRYAPSFFFVAAPLALLPYLAAFLAWVAATLALYAAMASRIAGSRLALVVACAAPAIFINAICGQNGPLTAVLIGGALLWLDEAPWLSGLCLGLLAYKPQFGILFPLVLIAGNHWRALLAAIVATAGVMLISGTVFGFDTLRAFVHYLPITSNSLLIHGVNGFGKLQTVYGLFRWLGYGNGPGWIAQGVLVIGVAGTLVWLWRQKLPFGVKAAALATGTLLATPHLYAYDFAVLTMAYAFLYRERVFDTLELACIVLANFCVGAFLFFPSPIGLVSLAITAGLIARRVVAAEHLAIVQRPMPAPAVGTRFLQAE